MEPQPDTKQLTVRFNAQLHSSLLQLPYLVFKMHTKPPFTIELHSQLNHFPTRVSTVQATDARDTCVCKDSNGFRWHATDTFIRRFTYCCRNCGKMYNTYKYIIHNSNLILKGSEHYKFSLAGTFHDVHHCSHCKHVSGNGCLMCHFTRKSKKILLQSCTRD
jgi:hypothetical protein